MFENERIRQLQAIAPITGVGAVLVLILVGQALFDPPLQSRRPPASEFQYTLEPLRIEARLWEDPFLALSRHMERQEAKAGSGQQQGSTQSSTDHHNDDSVLRQNHYDLSQLIRQSLGDPQTPTGKFALLAMLHDGRKTSEASEHRRRQRIAVVSALAQRGLIPLGDGHLYLTELAAIRSSLPKDKADTNAAYELFQYDAISEGIRHPVEQPKQPLRGAAVIWLDESKILGDATDSSPKEILSQVLLDLIPRGERKQERLQQMDFSVIGPASSKRLVRFAPLDAPAAAQEGETEQEEGDQEGETDEEEGDQGQPGGPSAPEAESQILEIARDYLDDPLESSCNEFTSDDSLKDWGNWPVSPQRLEKYQAKVTQSLQGLALEDSDQTWEETVSTLFIIGHGFTLLGLPENEARTLAQTELKELANSYLDDGLPMSATIDPPIQTLTETVPTNLGSLLDTFREKCTQSDSDRQWHATVLGLWRLGLTENPGANEQAAESADARSRRPNQPRVPAQSASRFVDDFEDPTQQTLKTIQERLRIYSALATAPLSLSRIAEQARNGEIDEKGVSNTPAGFHKVVVSDQELASQLIDELHLRGLGLEDDEGNDHLVLVSEWDTLYGRSLPLVFEVELQRRAKAIDAGSAPYEEFYKKRLNGTRNAPKNVHRFTYLRGLDGSTARPGLSDSTPKKATPGARYEDLTDLQRLRRLEAAEGPGQLDMIRRIGDQIADLDNKLRTDGRGRVQAIGVLGSDYHDKLLVLQALRNRFEDAIFFTTDLDARYLQPNVYGLTSNLLIASSFGLELHRSLQCRVPPFRYTYATATFAGVLAALQHTDPLPPREQADSEDACRPDLDESQLLDLEPRLFEVARNQFVPLDAQRAVSGIHPAWTSPSQSWRRVTRTSAPLLFLFFWILAEPASQAFPRLRRDLKTGAFRVEPTFLGRIGSRPWTRIGISLASVALVLALARLALSDAKAGGEPLLWLSGVSVWPSELLRLIAAVASLLLLVKVIVELRRRNLGDASHFATASQDSNGGESEADVEDDPRSTEPAAHDGGWRAWLRDFSEYFDLQTIRGHLLMTSWSTGREDHAADSENSGEESRGSVPPAHQPAQAPQVWRQYEGFSTFQARGIRTLVLFFFVVLVMCYLIHLFGLPHVPARSAEARWTHWGVLLISTTGLLLLATLVFDATLLCVRFIATLVGRNRSPKFDPTDLNKSFAAKRGLEVDDIGDVLALRIVGHQTAVVGRLLLYPFLVMSIFVIARSRLFDAWRWPWSIVLFVTAILVLLLGSAVVLQRAARQARSKAIHRLEVRRSKLLTADANAPRVKQVEAMIHEIQSLSRGAFASWFFNPVFGAVLLTVGAATLVWIAELVLHMGP